MTLSLIATARLHNQHLLKGLKSADDVVRSLVAVQSQDFTGAKWALGQRCTNTTDQAVTNLFNQGKILRTHMLRPTWHFVAPEDIRWVQELTAPRVHAFNKYYYKKLDLTEEILQKGSKALAKALEGGNYLTRNGAKEVFSKADIDANGLKLAYLVMYAELEAVVCSGPMQGKQHTLALVSERASQAKTMTRAKALAELTTRFFTTHGPATMQDFAWWSTLTMADIKEGIALAKLKSREVNGTPFFYNSTLVDDLRTPVVHLLPNYDEYVIAYKQREPFMSSALEKAPSYVDLSYHFIMLDGKLTGGWKRLATTKAVTVKLNLFKHLTAQEHQTLALTAKKLEHFTGLPVSLTQ